VPGPALADIERVFREEYGRAVAVLAALNRAVAVAEAEGPAAALAIVDDLDPARLSGYYLFHAIRADLLRRLGRNADAAAAYETALALTLNAAERAYLAVRLAEQRPHQPDGTADR
jgi:RNA polymerase sigma-70 factor, ECF subfamily